MMIIYHYECTSNPNALRNDSKTLRKPFPQNPERWRVVEKKRLHEIPTLDPHSAKNATKTHQNTHAPDALSAPAASPASNPISNAPAAMASDLELPSSRSPTSTTVSSSLETKRAAESAQRMRGALFRSYGFGLPRRLKLLKNAAGRRKTQLLFLSSGMEKREKNQSMFHQRKKSILWTIEWRFHSTNVVLLDHGVNEHECVVHVIEKHLKSGPWNHQLKPFCQEPLDSLKFLIQKNPKGPKTLYRELDIKAPIGQQLSGVFIVEYPVFHVFLPSHSYDFEVEKFMNTSSKDVKAAESLDDVPSPKGVLFREEEINENDASFDTQVMDFMNYMSQQPVVRGRGEEKEAILSTQFSEGMNPVSANEQLLRGGDLNGYFHCNMKASETSKDMNFEFEQDLRDAYSNLIGQVNPDDFLCLDGGFVEEELEEGEIVEF
ncbi:hypothetical protein ACLOJK_033130 [Asimina triloba]